MASVAHATTTRPATTAASATSTGRNARIVSPCWKAPTIPVASSCACTMTRAAVSTPRALTAAMNLLAVRACRSSLGSSGLTG